MGNYSTIRRNASVLALKSIIIGKSSCSDSNVDRNIILEKYNHVFSPKLLQLVIIQSLTKEPHSLMSHDLYLSLDIILRTSSLNQKAIFTRNNINSTISNRQNRNDKCLTPRGVRHHAEVGPGGGRGHQSAQNQKPHRGLTRRWLRRSTQTFYTHRDPHPL